MDGRAWSWPAGFLILRPVSMGAARLGSRNRSHDHSLTALGVPHIVALRLAKILKSCAMRQWAVLLLGVWLGGCANLDKFYTAETSESFPPTHNVAVVDGGQDAEAAYAA